VRRSSLVLAWVAALAVSDFAAAGSAGSVGVSTSPIAEVAAYVVPALVRIHAVEVNYRSGREIKSEVTGSGVIFRKQGYVITNHHVAGNARTITCMLASKEAIDCELVGTDPLTDICVLKLRPREEREFPAARFGDSSRLQVGDRVLALGSPSAISQSATMGIVSNTELVVPDLFWPFKFRVEGEDVGSIVRWIGHDAEISSGSSGGPLVNLSGEVVGINEMWMGLGAAIPGNLAQEVAEQLIANGEVVRAWTGLEVQPLLRASSGQEGLLVSGTIPASPAAEAGFRSGDILLSLGGSQVTIRVPEELPLFNRLAADLPVGKPAEAVVLRDGGRVVLHVTPEQRENVRPRAQELSEWGMTARDLSRLVAKELRRPTREGVLVDSIRPGGPCDQAKPRIMEKDVILAVAGRPVRNLEELVRATQEIPTGEAESAPVLVSFERKSERYLTVVKVGKGRPPEPGREVRKAWLPAATQVLTKDIAEALALEGRTGVRVIQVYVNHSAESAGLQAGDIIVALDGEPILASRPEHFDFFPAMVRQRRIGAEAELTVIRDGQEHRITVTLEESPALPREMQKYRDDNFEFAVRDLAFEDRVREGWTDDQQGALVEAVSEGSWAALGHLAVGDLILAVDGGPTSDVTSVAERMEQIAAERPSHVVLQVQRGIHGLLVELTPKWPSEE
jgi:serine protease Do